MTSLKQVQTREQILQETEKKIKKMKKLENIFIGGTMIGVSTGLIGTVLNNETGDIALTLSGFAAGTFSSIISIYTIINRLILEEYLKNYKKDSRDTGDKGNNRNYDSQYKSHNRYK